MTDATSDWTGLVPVAVFAFGVYQFWRNSQNAEKDLARKRAVEAVNELATFGSDANASLALKIFDYSGYPISIDAKLFPISDTRFIRGLRIHSDSVRPEEGSAGSVSEGSVGFVDWELALRSIIDDLLVRLERIEALIEADVIGQAQFGDLFSYWLKLAAEHPGSEDRKLTHFDDARRAALWRYIRTYEFNGVVRLFQRYGRAGSERETAEQAFRPR